ncbi:MAG: glycerol-3-phosphate 1-O-acyltransferase PlsY [Bryobacteraceae bacterium]|nr:glycerol-3-phosphate 1-O-acyltransferase PlsY [Bryobacteraceae bacterium]MDW8378244.1 glycerol-3-phosphate 1-O-acyltransferase PlsY [Bryobacterales bacterium]
MMPILSLLLAYLLGAIPFGYLLVRWKTGRDIRAAGSGNIGATNVLRTEGKLLGLLTLFLDILKGYVAVWITAKWTQAHPTWMALAAVACMLGHAYPVFLKFRGGKAVASFLGAFVYLSPLAVLATLIVFVAVVAATRYISLGSIVGALLFPLAVFLIQHPPASILLAALFGGWFIVWRHKSNIERLRAGTENVFRFGKSSRA